MLHVGHNVPISRTSRQETIVRVDADSPERGEATGDLPGYGPAIPTVGYLRSRTEGHAVADRARFPDHPSLTIMNDVMNGISEVCGDAYDPRAGGS
jgi:hypothetical protein